MKNDIKAMVDQLSGTLAEDAFKTSDALASIGGEDVLTAMVGLLKAENPESRIIAARTLGNMKNNNAALEPLLEAVQDPTNKSIAGDLLMAAEGFDVSARFVDFFRLFLFGSYKVSMVSKNLLDFAEFDVSARTVRKAKKHWSHYAHNAKHDEQYDMRESEVKAMLMDLEAFLNENETTEQTNKQ